MKNKAAVHLGRKGGKATKEKYGDNYLMEIAKRGGEVRKQQILNRSVDKVKTAQETA